VGGGVMALEVSHTELEGFRIGLDRHGAPPPRPPPLPAQRSPKGRAQLHGPRVPPTRGHRLIAPCAAAAGSITFVDPFLSRTHRLAEPPPFAARGTRAWAIAAPPQSPRASTAYASGSLPAADARHGRTSALF
jgi:hypothetical protein